jgi:hypothetical protein
VFGSILLERQFKRYAPSRPHLRVVVEVVSRNVRVTRRVKHP